MIYSSAKNWKDTLTKYKGVMRARRVRDNDELYYCAEDTGEEIVLLMMSQPGVMYVSPKEYGKLLNLDLGGDK